MTRPRGPGSHHGITFADQVVSNASNALIALLVAGASSSATFGLFAIAWSVSNFLVGLYRNAFAVHLSLAADNSEKLRSEMSGTVTAITLSAPLAVGLVILGGFLGTGTIGAVVILLGIASPIILVQDSLRYAAIAEGRAALALLSDSVWLIASLGGVAWRILGAPSAAGLLAMWCLGAAAAAAILLLGLRPGFDITGIPSWLKETVGNRMDLALGGLVNAASVPICAILIGALAGSTVIATIAGGGQLMAPVNTAVAFLSLGLLPRATQLARPKRVALFLRAAALISAGTLLWTAVLWFLPDSWGAALLGQTWASTHSIIWVFGIQYAIGTFAITGAVLLTSLGLTRSVMFQGLGSGLGRVGVVAAVAAAIGTAFALSAAEAALLLVSGVAVWWIALRFVRSTQALDTPVPMRTERSSQSGESDGEC